MRQWYLLLLLVAFSVRPAWSTCELVSQCGGFLYGGEVVPPVQSSLEGYAWFHVCREEISGLVTVSGSETVTSVGLYGPARRGEIGPLLLQLPLPVADMITLQSTPLSYEEWVAISLGVYVQVNTVEHPGGAARGQVEGEIAVSSSPWSEVKRLYR
jgi:CHRD domain